jgi:hypothetical protein
MKKMHNLGTPVPSTIKIEKNFDKLAKWEFRGRI